MTPKMITLVASVIYKTFDKHQQSLHFLQRLIICLAIIGVIFGILACYVSMLLGFVEILIAPALIWAIRSYRSLNKDTVDILNAADRTLSGARRQVEIEHKIKKEIEIEKQRGE